MTTLRRAIAAAVAAVGLIAFGGTAHAEPQRMSDAGYRAAAAARQNAVDNPDRRTFWLKLAKLAERQAAVDRRAGN